MGTVLGFATCGPVSKQAGECFSVSSYTRSQVISWQMIDYDTIPIYSTWIQPYFLTLCLLCRGLIQGCELYIQYSLIWMMGQFAPPNKLRVKTTVYGVFFKTNPLKYGWIRIILSQSSREEDNFHFFGHESSAAKWRINFRFISDLYWRIFISEMSMLMCCLMVVLDTTWYLRLMDHTENPVCSLHAFMRDYSGLYIVYMCILYHALFDSSILARQDSYIHTL